MQGYYKETTVTFRVSSCRAITRRPLSLLGLVHVGLLQGDSHFQGWFRQGCYRETTVTFRVSSCRAITRRPLSLLGLVHAGLLQGDHCHF